MSKEEQAQNKFRINFICSIREYINPSTEDTEESRANKVKEMFEQAKKALSYETIQRIILMNFTNKDSHLDVAAFEKLIEVVPDLKNIVFPKVSPPDTKSPDCSDAPINRFFVSQAELDNNYAQFIKSATAAHSARLGSEREAAAPGDGSESSKTLGSGTASAGDDLDIFELFSKLAHLQIKLPSLPSAPERDILMAHAEIISCGRIGYGVYIYQENKSFKPITPTKFTELKKKFAESITECEKIIARIESTAFNDSASHTSEVDELAAGISRIAFSASHTGEVDVASTEVPSVLGEEGKSEDVA